MQAAGPPRWATGGIRSASYVRRCRARAFNALGSPRLLPVVCTAGSHAGLTPKAEGYLTKASGQGTATRPWRRARGGRPFGLLRALGFWSTCEAPKLCFLILCTSSSVKPGAKLTRCPSSRLLRSRHPSIEVRRKVDAGLQLAPCHCADGSSCTSGLRREQEALVGVRIRDGQRCLANPTGQPACRRSLFANE